MRGTTGGEAAYHLVSIYVSIYLHWHTYWFLARHQGVEFAVVGKGEQSIGRDAQISNGVALETGQLPAHTAQSGVVHVECTILLAQVIVSLTVGCPYGVAVLAGKGGHALVRPTLLHVYVARNAAGMVLAPGILVALYIVVQYASVRCYAHMIHGYGREQGLSATRLAHLVQACEGTAGEGQFAHRGIACTAYEQRIGIKPCSRVFVEGVCGHATSLSALCRHHKHIHRTLPAACKGQFLAIGAPQRVAVITGIRSQLLCLATHRRHRVDVAHVGKGYATTIRRDGTATHPQRFCHLGITRHAHSQACNKR